MLFLDAANRDNPVPHLYELESTNPCVTGDTLVATPSGWQRVDAIKEGDEICTVLGTGRVQDIEVHEAVPVFEVTLSDGGKLRVTAAHQFHTRDSSTKFFEPKRADQLSSGDWVRVYKAAMPDNDVLQGSIGLDDRLYGFLVGILVGDGCYTPRALSKNVVRISTHADDEAWNAIITEAFTHVGSEKMYSYVNKDSRGMMMDPKPGRTVAAWVRSLPLTPAHSREKSLPECYINSNRDFLEGLLDGLFSTDGSVDLSSNHPIVRFHTASKLLAEQVRRILLMFGIHGRIFESIRKRHDINGREIRHDRPKYDVMMSGESFGRFFEQIRLSHPAKQYRMEEAALRSNFTGGNWAAKVINIRPVGVEKVYDLYEPRSDTWITEGYVSRGCGEQFLGPFENCCLGSVNLAQHVTADGKVDWDKLRDSVELSTRFLDDVVDANTYVPAVPQLQVAAHRVRRIGLGIMGLGDLMFSLGVRYGSKEGQEFASQLMEFVHFHAMNTSVELAKERGSFLAIRGSLYDPADLKWSAPEPLIPHTTDWGRPSVDWQSIVDGIKANGIRNGAQTTIAPTGTISTVAGCEGYGCEPVFALAYTRHFNDNGKDTQLQYTSPQFEKALIDAGLSDDQRQKIIEQVNLTGSCQDVEGLPDHIRHAYVVASDISAEEHVWMQAVMQRFCSNAISKTCNFPSTATVDDVAKAYQLAWELGCKGLTVYVSGSRDKVVLETAETAKAKEPKLEAKPEPSPAVSTPAPSPAPSSNLSTDAAPWPLPMFGNEIKKPRSRVLKGYTYRLETPLGTTFVTINENGGDQPFEVFMHTAKAGSDTAAVSEAMGRLISYILRMNSPIEPRKRLKEIVRQLEGIGGRRSLGLGPKRVESLPDGIAQVLDEYIHRDADPKFGATAPIEAALTAAPEEKVKPAPGQMSLLQTKGDLCPECGQAAVIAEEGCRKCYACGFSEC
jgi:ribonucleotide reductase alpha subunit